MTEDSKYTFFPSMRRGLSTRITAVGRRRGFINVSLKLESWPKGNTPELKSLPNKTVEIYGPGDIRGFDERVVVRTDPKHSPEIGDFEPNYFPMIEFAEPDFAWRYSPEVLDNSDNGNLLPWITLIALKEDEYEEGARGDDQVPWIAIKDSVPLPDLSQAGYWAHLHIAGDVATKAAREAVVRNERDRVICRLLCPRHLEPKSRYTAFVVPTFKLGVYAGLGWKPGDGDLANTLAWDIDKRESDMKIPYYFKWSFGTGLRGDFEYAVRLLRAQAPADGVGYRTLDCSNPGYGVPAVNRTEPPPEESHIIDMGGALIPITDGKTNVDTGAPREADEEFRKALARLLNREKLIIEDVDFFKEVTISVNEWGKDVRIACQTVRASSCTLMYGSTKALGEKTPLGDPDSLEKVHYVNLTDISPGQKIYFKISATESNGHTHGTDVLKFFIPDVPTVLPPLYGRWHAARTFVDHQESSDKPWFHELNLDPKFRSAAGMGSMVVQKQQNALMTSAWEQLGSIEAANDIIRRAQLGRELTGAVHDKLDGLGLDDFLQITGPVHRRTRLDRCPKKYDEHGMGKTAYVHFKEKTDVPDVVFDRALQRLRGPFRKRQKNNNSRQGNFIQKLFNSDIAAAGPHEEPMGTPSSAAFGDIEKVSDEMVNVVNDTIGDIFHEPEEQEVIPPATLEDVQEAIICSLDPTHTICDRTRQQIELSSGAEVNCFERIMAYPKFPQPMYKTLKQDQLISGLEKISQNSITLLKSNRKFIESFMAGFNHGLAGELLWREYPTDQRGSYARQFWDPSDYLPPKNKPDDDSMERWRERLKDIRPLDEWKGTLGEHRVPRLKKEDQIEEKVVLVVRGDLLKKHPNTRIYAIKATIDENDEPIPYLEEFAGSFNENVSKNNFPEPVTPVFSGQIEPDITFLGFPIDETKALGYFFVFEERPMEIRFGLDVPTGEESPDSLSNLAWNQVGMVEENENGYIDMNTEVRPKDDDSKVWGESSSSARIASITFQKAFRMSIHADKLISLK